MLVYLVVLAPGLKGVQAPQMIRGDKGGDQDATRLQEDTPLVPCDQVDRLAQLLPRIDQCHRFNARQSTCH